MKRKGTPHMSPIWTPWRMKYIQSNKSDGGCVFCLAAGCEDSPKNLIIAREEHAFIILNRFPYTNGHLMVVPYQHCANLEDLSPVARQSLLELANRSVRVLKSVYHPQGFNIGINLGNIAGAGVAEHLHVHVVPRWSGDNNFMGVIGDVRVIPEALEDTYKRLREAWITAK